jgi:hypothetical protein
MNGASARSGFTSASRAAVAPRVASDRASGVTCGARWRTSARPRRRCRRSERGFGYESCFGFTFRRDRIDRVVAASCNGWT